MLSRRFAAVVVIVIVVAFVVVAVAPAFASGPAALPMHASLTSSTPADGATVSSADEVVLTFNEEVNPDFVAVKVTGPDGSETDGDPSVDGRAVTQRLASDLPAGRHEVTYRVVSADGHPVAGTLTFSTTAAPASSSPTATASATSTPTTGAPTPTATATTAPVSGADGNTPWLAILVVGLVAAAGLGALWRVIGRSRAGADDGRTAPV